MCNKKSTIFVVCPIGDEGTETRKNSDAVLRVIKNVVRNNKELSGRDVIRADEMEEAGLIAEKIYKQLKTSDVCVVDLTDLNPNVLYEFGIRHALLKPSVLIAKKGTKPPFDIQGLQIIYYDTSNINWGAELDDRLKNSLPKAIESKIDGFYEMLFKPSENDSEILCVHPKRIIMETYKNMMENARKNIDVLGYSLERFSENNRDSFEKYKNENIEIKIRILVVDPNSEYSKKRENDEGDISGTHKIRIEELREFLSKYDFVELRKISTPPSSMIFRIDDNMFVGPYLYKLGSANTETFQLKKTGKLSKLYEAEFEKMWKDGEKFVC